jgi:hypothetical protein
MTLIDRFRVATAARPEQAAVGRIVAAADFDVAADGHAPPLTGFVESDFSPVVVEVAGRCLVAAGWQAPVPAALGDDVAVVLVSAHGDLATNRAVAAAVDAGRKAPPLLFFQSVPNAVLGHVARVWGLRGPVVCVSPLGDPAAGVEIAEGLLADGDALAVLVILAEPDPGPGAAVHSATAVLLGGVGLPGHLGAHPDPFPLADQYELREGVA